MREQSEAAYRPYVAVTPFLEPDNPIFYLRIGNLGGTAAINLRLSIDRSFFKFGDRVEKNDLASFSVFNHPIDSLPPGAEMVFALAQSFVVFDQGADPSLCPQLFTVTANYEFGSNRIEERHTVDLRPYLHADVPQDAIIRKLSAIQDQLVKLTAAVKASRSAGRKPDAVPPAA